MAQRNTAFQYEYGDVYTVSLTIGEQFSTTVSVSNGTLTESLSSGPTPIPFPLDQVIVTDVQGGISSGTAGPGEFRTRFDDLLITQSPAQVHLPLVVREHGYPPDLVVAGLYASGDDVVVVIQNQGQGAVDDEFWVDVYIDPDPVPTAVNDIWYDGRCEEGLAWGVNASALPMEPGTVLVLTVGDEYYSEYYSYFTGALPSGTPVYAHVDAVNLDTTFGGVLEDHEISGGEYNNLMGPVYSTGLGMYQGKGRPAQVNARVALLLAVAAGYVSPH